MNPVYPKIYGLIGYPVKHSFSPVMHNSAFNHLNINAEYRLFEVKPEELEAFLLENIPVKDTTGRSFYSKDIVGFNITIPHKVRAKEILEREFSSAEHNAMMLRHMHFVKLTGAINTVRRVNGQLIYFNTDSVGFLESLKRDLGFNTKEKKALVIGCGGAGRSVIAGLSWRQNRIKKIYIYDIHKKAVDSAINQFSKFPKVMGILEPISRKHMPDVVEHCDLLVNASSCGMREKDMPVVGKYLLHKNLYIYDVIYHRQTRLIKDARSLNLPAANGLGMLLYQGAQAFEIWTEKNAPIEVMKQALDKEIRAK